MIYDGSDNITITRIIQRGKGFLEIFSKCDKILKKYTQDVVNNLKSEKLCTLMKISAGFKAKLHHDIELETNSSNDKTSCTKNWVGIGNEVGWGETST